MDKNEIDHAKHFTQIPNAWLYLDIHSTEFKVLCVILSHATWGKGTGSFPSRKTISKRCGVTVGQVQKLINQLRDKGLIRWISGTENRSNEYTLIDIDAPMHLLGIPHAPRVRSPTQPPSCANESILVSQRIHQLESYNENHELADGSVFEERDPNAARNGMLKGLKTHKEKVQQDEEDQRLGFTRT